MRDIRKEELRDMFYLYSKILGKINNSHGTYTIPKFGICDFIITIKSHINTNTYNYLNQLIQDDLKLCRKSNSYYKHQSDRRKMFNTIKKILGV